MFLRAKLGGFLEFSAAAARSIFDFGRKVDQLSACSQSYCRASPVGIFDQLSAQPRRFSALPRFSKAAAITARDAEDADVAQRLERFGDVLLEAWLTINLTTSIMT
jgi:hypothetical protein